MDATPAPSTVPVEPAPVSALGQQLRQVMLAVHEARVAMARRMDLRPSDADALEHVMGGAIGPVELSRHLHMSSASATVLLDRLEDAGLVVREPDPTDGRRRVVRPTAKGTATVYAEVGPLIEDLTAAETGMSARDRDVVGRYLARVVAAFEINANPRGDTA